MDRPVRRQEKSAARETGFDGKPYIEGKGNGAKRIPGMTDQQIVLKAFDDLLKIAADYIEPGPRISAEATLQRMLEIIEREEVVAAAERLEQGFGLRVIK
jgi:hypothetical protein